MTEKEREQILFHIWVLRGIAFFGTWGTDPKAKAAAQVLKSSGLVVEKDDQWSVTPKGEAVLDRIAHRNHV